MIDSLEILLSLGTFVIALLYSSVGHGGATGYLALLAIAGIPHTEARCQALIMNVFVSGIAFVGFTRNGSRLPIAIFLRLGIPAALFAFIGAKIPVGAQTYQAILGIFLFIVSARIFWMRAGKELSASTISNWWQVLLGAGIGLLSGILGIGGGVILSPLLILIWGYPFATVARISAAFIFCNSIAGLVAIIPDIQFASTFKWLPVVTAIAGAITGSMTASRFAGESGLRKLLSIVLFLAAVKLLYPLVTAL